MDEQRIREIVREELVAVVDKYVFDANLKFLDGKNIQTGRTNGSSFGMAPDQKVGFHGMASIQANAITQLGSAPSSYSQAFESTVVTAVNDIINALQGKGIIA